MSTISYAITACNEHVELKKLIDQLQGCIRKGDEIVVQIDSDKASGEVISLINEYVYHAQITRDIKFPLNNDFATFKNNLKSHCTKDYIIQLDADELLGDYLKNNLIELIEANPDVDMFAVPRINIVLGLTEEYVIENNWHISSGKFPICIKHDTPSINFPDFQERLFKNIPEIVWVNKVHERLEGYKKLSRIYDNTLTEPDLQDFCLLHVKTLDRQKKQNSYYRELMRLK